MLLVGVTCGLLHMMSSNTNVLGTLVVRLEMWFSYHVMFYANSDPLQVASARWVRCVDRPTHGHQCVTRVVAMFVRGQSVVKPSRPTALQRMADCQQFASCAPVWHASFAIYCAFTSVRSHSILGHSNMTCKLECALIPVLRIESA